MTRLKSAHGRVFKVDCISVHYCTFKFKMFSSAEMLTFLMFDKPFLKPGDNIV